MTVIFVYESHYMTVIVVTLFMTIMTVIMTQQLVTQVSVTGIDNLKTIALVQKSASDHPYSARNETVCVVIRSL